MKIAVTYYSETGNTKKVAEEIANTIGEEIKIIQIEDFSSFDNYDLIFLGFPIHQFGVPKPVNELLHHIINKKIVLFVTHAMPENIPLFKNQINNCISALANNEVIDVFSCKGELSQKAAKQMQISKNELLKNFSKMRVNTVNHPNQEDLNNVSHLIRQLLDSLNFEL